MTLAPVKQPKPAEPEKPVAAPVEKEAEKPVETVEVPPVAPTVTRKKIR